jgi:hypothetical protein
MARLVLIAAVTLAMASCGGGDDEEAEDARGVVRDFVEATNQRDGERLCGELLTQEYKEKATGATGDRADEACERLLEVTRGLRLDLISVGRTRVDGEQATVRAVLDTDGVQAPRLFQLEKEDGSWRLASGTSE